MSNKFPIGQSFQRLTDSPLDETIVFDTLAQAQDYASNNPTAYKGQVIHVKDARTPSEIDDGIFIYEETCYIDLLKNVKPICSFTYEAMGLFFDLMYEMLNEPTEETRNKLDNLKEIMYDNYTYDYTYDINEVPTGDYHTQPWHPANYNGNQMALKMTRETASLEKGTIGYGKLNDPYDFGDPKIYIKPTISTEVSTDYGFGYVTEENIEIERNGRPEYYKVFTFNYEGKNKKISFQAGNYIERVIYLGDTSELVHLDFKRCYNLVAIDCLRGINLNATDMSEMFYECNMLETPLDLSHWDTSNVTSMASTFRGCHKVPSFDLSTWNTSKVTDMSRMFLSCKALRALDLSNFDTHNVTTFSQMFQYSSRIKKLNLNGFYIKEGADYDSMLSNVNGMSFPDDISMEGCTEHTIEVIKSFYI